MKKLNSYQDLTYIPIGYRWESGERATGYFWTLIFGILTGDLNRAHISLVSFFKSRFGRKKVRHGISIMAQAEACVHRIFSFAEATEIITAGYDTIRYRQPAVVGSKARYIYTLESVSIDPLKERARTKWRMEGVDETGRTIMTSIWLVDYNKQEPKTVRVARWLQRLMGWKPQIPILDVIVDTGRTIMALAFVVALVATPFLWPVDAIVAL